MSSSVELNGRPLSSTTPSLMACDSFCRLCSKPSTSLSCTSKTARNIGTKHVFLHGTQKVALCRHLLLRHHFPPCMHLHSRSPHVIKGPPSAAPHATRCFAFSAWPKQLWLHDALFASFVPDCPPGTSTFWYSCSSYSVHRLSFKSVNLCFKLTFHVAWAHVSQVFFQGFLDICFWLQLNQCISPASPIPV